MAWTHDIYNLFFYTFVKYPPSSFSKYFSINTLIFSYTNISVTSNIYLYDQTKLESTVHLIKKNPLKLAWKRMKWCWHLPYQWWREQQWTQAERWKVRRCSCRNPDFLPLLCGARSCLDHHREPWNDLSKNNFCHKYWSW